jgi:hypothetical protein
MKIRILLYSAFLAGALSSCNSQNAARSGSVNTNADTTATTSAPESLNSTESQNLLDQWVNAINTQNQQALVNFYGDAVTYNGQVLDSATIARNIVSDMKSKGIDRVQISDLTADAPSPDVRRIEFTKTLFSKGAKQEQTSLLLLENHNGLWKITAENDKAKEVEMTQKTPRYMAAADIKSCDDAARAIFLSSPEVKEMLGNPQVEYKMEYAPSDPANPNHRYWFWIYMPHAGGSETYGRYEVDPSTGQLYEYNQVTSDIKPTEYDRKLASYMKKCSK